MQKTLRALGLLAACTTAIYVAGCTATYGNETSTQCRSQADCLDRGADFADTTCSIARVCVKLEVAQRACTTNADCTTRAGVPSICRKSDFRCAPLTSTECTKIFADKDDLLDDNTIFVGMVLGSEINASFIEPMVELARVQIKRKLGGGLPPLKPGGPVRPLAVVECAVEPNAAALSGSIAEVRRAVTHLSNLGIPAVLGPQVTASALQGLAQLISLNMVALTSNSLTEISNLADQDLVFRTGFADRDTVEALTPFLNDQLYPRMVADGLVAPGGDIRVLPYKMGPNNGGSITDALPAVLKFNQAKPALENGANYRVVDFGDAADVVNNPDPGSISGPAIRAGLAYNPNFILWASTPGSMAQMIIPFNRQWPVGTPRPYQMTVIPAMTAVVVNGLRVINSDEQRRRFFGFRNFGIGYTDEGFSLFKIELTNLFPDLLNAPVNAFQANFYDSMYILALAISSGGENEAVDSTLIRKGIRRVTDPGGVITSFNDPQKGIADLRAGKNLLLKGVTGLFSFDAKGDRPGFVDTYCVNNGGTPPIPTAVVATGWSYDLVTKTASGSIQNCN